MPIVKTSVARMTTSRTDDTKYEYYVMMHRDDGRTRELYMHYLPERSLYEAMSLAKFLHVPCDPLVVDGSPVELDGTLKSMLENDDA
jgi:hypothetical protein